MPKFKLVKKSNGEVYAVTAKGISKDECVSLIEDNELYEYRIEEIVVVSRSTEDSDEIREANYLLAREKFMDSLTASQYSDIKEKRKTIAHNAEQGFYLRSVKEGLRAGDAERNFSFYQIEEKRRLELRSALRGLLTEVSRGQLLDYNRIEVEDCIDELFKTK